MGLQFVLVILLATYLRKAFKTKVAMPEWHKRLNLLLFAGIAVMILQLLAPGALKPVFGFMEYIPGGMLLYIIYQQPEFKPAKFLLVALLPCFILNFVADVLKLAVEHVYPALTKYAETAVLFSILWGIGVWIVTNRQRKELLKAQTAAFEEQENNRMITAMKAQLEIQVAERTQELTRQKEALQITLDELKSTQAQLIQSEKMASLGELTAGIAHEIQNPLNFVNNFSEVNKELIAELVDEVNKGNTDEVKLIAGDIKDNSEKINFHGKRADAIVKGMLQHSRQNKGAKEPTDINALCDEYLRLSYHGLRAKDKSFNANFKTEFDESIGKINVVPQDMGRVLLNLFNNAFYTVNEKRKTNDKNYKPEIIVRTKKLNDEIEISVTDNGNGIPQNIIDKIFQPFFTTKPTGSGTGLGLSLSYDIVKANEGEIKAESEEGKGSTFTISLPVA